MTTEIDKVKERYARRTTNVDQGRYSFMRPSVWQCIQERQRAIVMLLDRLGYSRLEEVSLLEVGSGSGSNLLEFLRMGFLPRNLTGIELLPERVAEANSVLPAGIVQEGDANSAVIPDESQDIVYQSVVFSSLLDDSFQEELAGRMWSWVKPGGGVLWYDFTYSNPSNPDVRGIKASRVRRLFPEATVRFRRITLAPPLSRLVTRVHPGLYGVFNALPILRTHILCWLAKPS